ncbi:inositol monophosphatase family protein [Arsenicicoccus sp. oral taxon 190]|uniref:inositol monophosphatase family protein n=1 Tax=Arsenicicoccus sp. oral taxon 190 TaxID=1658671 RepID=UPI000679FF65|nr:inositol monophosphatase family protein [Arsenicicoccus sp. oral taxon 190]AKT52012.1 inositol-phosphate phosphatase [Arsenicicoccus sp. oral taxon 190]
MSQLLTPPAADLSALETLALDVARACGRLIVDQRPGDLGVAATKTSLTDVVTIMDQRSEALARELLTQARPEDGFHGEESSRVPSRSGLTWVVDPIDGTVNYLYDIPAYAVSVAAVVGDPAVPGGWEPVAAAVVDPVAEEAHVAHRGGGARLLSPAGERALGIREGTELGAALLGTGFGYEARVRADQGQVIAAVLPEVRDIRRRGSAALDLCWVADGRLDAYFERGLHEWDLAGGWLVVTEAGGVVRGLAGAHLADPFTIAGPTGLVDRLDALLERVATPR